MKLATAYILNQPFDINVNIENSLNKGSAWNNLYIPYKYESQLNVNNLTQKQQIEYYMMCYNFQIIELNLYLDTHKDDIQAFKYLNKLITEYDKIKTIYNQNYQALDVLDSNYQNSYTYISNPWPWEENK